MICPKCKELGEKSTVYEHGMVSTCANVNVYYDEDGNRHWHDPNRSTISYSCNRGHNFGFALANKCSSCDFGNDKDEVVIGADNTPGMIIIGTSGTLVLK